MSPTYHARWLLSFYVLFLFICTSVAQAEADSLVFGNDAIYTKDLSKKPEFPKQIEKIFKNRAMMMLVGRDGIHPISALDMMSRIFITDKFGDAKNHDDGAKLILGMSGIKISSALKYNAIYIHPKGYVVHFKVSGGDVALFFQGYGIDSVDEIKSEILKSGAVAKGDSMRLLDSANALVSLLLPGAWAVEPEPALCGGPIQKSSNGSTNASLLQKVWGCTKGAVGGVWDSTGGAAWSVVKGAYGAVVHPVETFDKASAAISNISAMMSDMQGAFGQLKSAYSALPDDVKWKLGCEMVSAIGTTGLIAYFSAGAGSPLLVRTIAQSLTKIGSALPAGSAAATQTLALAGKMTAQAAQVAEIQGFIAQGADGKQFVDKIKQFDNVIADVNKSHTDLYFASTVPKNNGWRGKIIDDISERAAFDKAVKTRDAMSESDPAFMNAVYTAREAKKDWQMATDPEVKARILKELEKSQKLSPAQKAAAAAYLSASGCNLASKMSDTANEAGATTAPAAGTTR